MCMCINSVCCFGEDWGGLGGGRISSIFLEIFWEKPILCQISKKKIVPDNLKNKVFFLILSFSLVCSKSEIYAGVYT